jgi:hypothetical protein
MVVTRVSSSGDCEPLDPHLVTRQSQDLTGVARGLNSHRQSEGPERHRDIGSLEDRRSGHFIVKTLIWIWTIHLEETCGGDIEKLRHRGIASCKIPRLNQDHPSVETGGDDQEPVDISHVRFSGFRRTG